MGCKTQLYVDIMSAHPEVTGSLNLVVVKFPDKTTTRFVVDCGLFQEKEYCNYNKGFPFDGENIDFALVTHNHVDHIGRLPLLVKEGFEGKIYASTATCTFAPYALYDSHKVLKDIAKRNHEHVLYSETNVFDSVGRFVPCRFKETIQVDDHIRVTFLKNGHLIGAALILVQIKYPGCDDINLLFTGDYADRNMFFEVPNIPDWVLNLPLTIVQESTYGTTNSSDNVMTGTFEKNILNCLEKGGIPLVLVFSLGRAQEILYVLKRMQDKGKLSKEIPIYFDGKLAQQYTTLYLTEDFGIKGNMQKFLPENLINVDKGNRESVVEGKEQKIIVTTSGMGTYGPAQVYIPEYITRENAMLHFTGFTAEGTMGEKLKNTQKGDIVNVNGVIVKKRADVEYTTEFSAHAKADVMIDFLKKFKNLRLVLVNHGETAVKEKFAERIVEEVSAKNVAILDRGYFFRVGPYGLIRTLTTKFE